MEGQKTTKADIVESIYLSTNLSKKDIRVVVDHLIEVLKTELSDGKVIELRGLGTFELKQRKGREKARNPKTGEIVSVDSHCVVAFRSGKELKSRVWNLQIEKKE